MKKGKPVNPQQSVGFRAVHSRQVSKPSHYFRRKHVFHIVRQAAHISISVYPALPGEGEARSGISGISVIYAISLATNNASGLMLSNCVPKYMVATYDTRNGSYFSISTFSSASPLP